MSQPTAIETHADQVGGERQTGAWVWYSEGDRFFSAMLEAIGAARVSVRLETYIFEESGIGLRVRDSLAAAARRGVCVQVLVDGFGSSALPAEFWVPLRESGGGVRVFNPPRLRLLSIRDHRKLVVCDDAVAFVGGFNIAPDYEGDGVCRGWRDVGLRLGAPLAPVLSVAFDRMFANAAFQRKPFALLRRSEEKGVVQKCPGCGLILGGPGRGGSPLLRALRQDLRQSSSVRIMVAYFLPTPRLWRDLLRAARRNRNVELIVPAQSDVALSKLATESLYRRLLRAGVRVFEYQPRMLHGKLFVIDDVAYVGSSNLDPRSLRLNYELMVRLADREAADGARDVFDECRQHCREVTRSEWRRQRTLWTRVKQRFAHLIMGRLDPWITMSQWRSLPD